MKIIAGYDTLCQSQKFQIISDIYQYLMIRDNPLLHHTTLTLP